MPATDPEPEKYSIDDIMDRLRSRGEGSQDGEAKLVTREDGTQVYKMRKRKRRSQQPKKDKEKRQRRMHVGLVVTSVGLVILLGLAFGASLIYMNSGAYRGQITDKIRIWTGAEPKLTELRLTPASAAASGLELKWPAGSLMDELKLGAINGNLEASHLPKGVWKGSELLAASGTLSLRPQPMVPGKADASREECPFQFRYRSNKFNVVMGNPEKPVFRVRESGASLVPLEKGSAANLQFVGGYLDTADWGNFQLEFASLQFEGGAMRVGGVRLVPPSGGKAEIRIANPSDLPLDMSGEGTELDLHLDRVPLAELLGPSFGTWLSTTVETPESTPSTPALGKLLVRSEGKGGLAARASVRSAAGAESTTSGLPLFRILSSQLNDEWYEKPHFDVMRADVVKDREHAGVENLSLEARGRMAIQGTVIAKPDGRLEGTLELGLPAAAVVASKQLAMRSLFTRQAGDLLWASVKVSGTARNPTDDLEARLAAPGSARATSPGKSNPESLEETFRELTTPEEK
ncbi:hypothetical protein [Haloferula sp. BvORR071]|uniref:hypothetical protein n=1 Tax=Haloferula sp. BvORR071 TaxID=1396141 RepID=UPI00054E55EB|nr:hypothetical protein [Haloferula sp. BvORR071]